MLNCRVCGVVTRVLETRGTGEWVARRRECVGCKARVTTVEVVKGSVVREAQGPRVRSAPTKAVAAQVGSKNNEAGIKARAVARRRLEDLRDAEEFSESELSISADDLRRELGW